MPGSRRNARKRSVRRRDSAEGEVSLSIINDFPVSGRLPAVLRPTWTARLYARNMLKSTSTETPLRRFLSMQIEARSSNDDLARRGRKSSAPIFLPLSPWFLVLCISLSGTHALSLFQRCSGNGARRGEHSNANGARITLPREYSTVQGVNSTRVPRGMGAGEKQEALSGW